MLTLKRTIPFHDLGLSDLFFDPLLLDTSLLCVRPPGRFLVFAFEAETGARLACWMFLATFLPSKAADETAYLIH